MAYCKNCGSEINETVTKCPDCGATQLESRVQPSGTMEDIGGFGWGLLGFCIPIVGIVLYFVWKEERPNTAKSLIQGALIGGAIYVLGNILTACVGLSL